MKFSTIFVAAAALVGSAFASPEADHNIEKRAFDAITGVPGAALPRLEIRTLRDQFPDQFNLYVLALQRFQGQDQNAKMSYYQIAGVHGRPFIQWNDVPGVRSTGGYCPHVSNMFVPWHRPYLALYEQKLLENARAVVNAFPASQRARWSAAADRLRIPYWDWAISPRAGLCTVPQFMRDSAISVITPAGVQTIANPLYSYRFHPVTAQLGGAPFNAWATTLRRPVGSGSTARSNNNEWCTVMNSNRVGLRNRVYNLFTRTTLFRLFSTSATGAGSGNPENHDSIESVHDALHVITGGATGGHMYYLDYSAFDPAFWLHHTNIDRLAAMFQVINPNTYVVPGATTQNSFIWTRGEVKDANTPLRPFTRNSAGTFWTPNTARSTRAFNYFYPETAAGATAASVRSAINRIYGPNASGTANKRALEAGGSVDVGDVEASIDVKIDEAGVSVDVGLDAEVPSAAEVLGNTYEGTALKAGDRDYSASIRCDKFSVGGSYQVEFYLKPYHADNSTYPFSNATSPYSNTTAESPDDYYVGLYGVLAPFEKQDASTIISGVVSLTTALQDKYVNGEIPSLDETFVEGYLEKCLYWKVTKAGGEVVDSTAVSDLKVGVYGNEVLEAASEDSFPSYDPPKFYPTVTKNKPHGYAGTPDLVDAVCEKTVKYEYVDAEGKYLYSKYE